MFENKRSFTEAEIKQAEARLQKFAKASAVFWAKAFMSPCFHYKDKLIHYNTRFSGRVMHLAGIKPDNPITQEQINNFITIYIKHAQKQIAEWLKDDLWVASILGKKERLNVDWKHLHSYSCSFGGWGYYEAYGILAKAQEEAGLDGTMEAGLNGPVEVKSRYRHTSFNLADGKAYIQAENRDLPYDSKIYWS